MFKVYNVYCKEGKGAKDNTCMILISAHLSGSRSDERSRAIICQISCFHHRQCMYDVHMVLLIFRDLKNSCGSRTG